MLVFLISCQIPEPVNVTLIEKRILKTCNLFFSSLRAGSCSEESFHYSELVIKEDLLLKQIYPFPLIHVC